MGLDPEDGGPGTQGPVSLYRGVVDRLLEQVTNGGSGILVIGANKMPSPPDEVTTFWNTLAAIAPAIPITYVNGPANISNQAFAGFALLAVVSDAINASFGGLTATENVALAGRAADIAAFVDGGGGLLGFSSQFGPDSFGYMADLGPVTINGFLEYTNITPTPEGMAAGITDAFDAARWNQTFTTFPSFVQALATANRQGQPFDGQAAVIGGVTPEAPPPPPSPPPVPEIPEPGTLAIWTLFGVIGLGYGRYRQLRSAA
jgi:hypothetical protein